MLIADFSLHENPSSEYISEKIQKGALHMLFL